MRRLKRLVFEPRKFALVSAAWAVLMGVATLGIWLPFALVLWAFAQWDASEARKAARAMVHGPGYLVEHEKEWAHRWAGSALGTAFFPLPLLALPVWLYRRGRAMLGSEPEVFDLEALGLNEEGAPPVPGDQEVTNG